MSDSLIISSLASMPSRKNTLKHVVEVILPQVDKLYVHLNNYESPPSFLEHSKIEITKSQDYGDLLDNGKFLKVDRIPECYFFTLDDDIAYPSNYIARMVEQIDLYGRQCIFGVHGARFSEPFERYFPDREVSVFWDKLERDWCVNILGTGTMAFHSSTIELSLKDFESTAMADIWMGIAAKKQGIPMIAIHRPENWLTQLALENPQDCLYEKYKDSDVVQSSTIKSQMPWDFVSNQKGYQATAKHLQIMDEKLLIENGVDVKWWRSLL